LLCNLYFSNQIVGIIAAAGSPISLALWPNAKDQIQYGASIRPSQFFSVAKTCKYPEWAVKFIDFFTNDLEANKILLSERGVPISSKIREGLKPYLGDAEKQMLDFIDLAIKHSSTVEFEFMYPPKNQQVIDYMKAMVERMFYGELTPEKAA